MDSLCRLKILLIHLWMGAFCLSGLRCSEARINHLSKEDVLLLKDEPDPKCFARTADDFTCFFESAGDKTYDLLYKFGRSMGVKRCEMSVQRTDEGTFLHVCSFPELDVLLLVDIHLQVVERTTNKSLHVRIVNVEAHFLLEPPFNVSLHPNGRVGQLQVFWLAKVFKYLGSDTLHRIRYSFGTRKPKIKEVKDDHTLDSLASGDEVEVQVSIKSASDGHWSSWSHSARALVPQSADDVSLQCFTSDLRHVTCQWNGSRYGPENEFQLFYGTSHRGALSWTQWTECLPRGDVADLCRFSGDVSKRVKVKLSSSPTPLSRILYSEAFTLNDSIKTSPPSNLTGMLQKNKLYLKWDAPLPSLLPHLEYEVDYQIRGGGWKMTSGPQTEARLEVPAGSRYSVKVRAKPAGSIYSGHWSDWSPALTGDAPSDIGIWLMLFIPVSLLIMAIILISLFFTHLSKLKQYFWPPVPNLDKVLQGFLTEINRQTWDPPATAKLCSEETASSVVEVMSDDKVTKASAESTELLSAEGSFCGSEQVTGSFQTEVSPDYVTLSKDSVFLCPQGNSYVYEQVREGGQPSEGDEPLEICEGTLTNESTCLPARVGADFLNRSYLCPAEPDGLSCKATATSREGNLYANFSYC